MGVDYTAKAVIGVSLPDKEDLPRAIITSRKRAFEHNYVDDGSTEYDSKDGRKLWLDEKEEVEADYPALVFDFYNCLYSSDLELGQRLIEAPEGFKFAIKSGTDNNCLGVVVETGSSNGGDNVGFSVLPDIAEVETRLKSLLEPLGLWDKDKFGLYVILYCSY